MLLYVNFTLNQINLGERRQLTRQKEISEIYVMKGNLMHSLKSVKLRELQLKYQTLRDRIDKKNVYQPF